MNSAYAGSAFLHEVIEKYLAETRPQDIADFSVHGHFDGPSVRIGHGPADCPGPK
jgi:hypothetical protein